MTSLIPNSVAEWLATLLVAVPAAALTINRIRRSMSSDATARIETEARGNIVDDLRAEISRHKRMNNELLTALEKAQTRIIQMQADNTRLRLDIEALGADLQSLKQRYEVSA